jgi:hypothetical protein
MEQLNSLPYLENVVREILRLYPPGPSVARCSTEDTIIPVSEPYLDQMGTQKSGIWSDLLSYMCYFPVLSFAFKLV